MRGVGVLLRSLSGWLIDMGKRISSGGKAEECWEVCDIVVGLVYNTRY